jgi:CRP/FNR family transcriptional regulator
MREVPGDGPKRSDGAIAASVPATDMAAHSCEHCDVRSLGICVALSETEQKRLKAIATNRSYATEDTIFSAEDPASIVGTIVRGAVKTYKLLPDGRQQVVGFLFPGDFVGSAVFKTNRCFAEALSPVDVCVFPYAPLQRLMTEMPALEHQMLKLAHDDLDLAQEWMLLLGRKTAQERVATFLCLLFEKAKRRGHCGAPIDLPMNRSEIADYLGLTIETVSRQLSKLKQAGVIAILGSHAIELRKPQQLSELAAGGD